MRWFKNSQRLINAVALTVGLSALGLLIYEVGLAQLASSLLAIGPAFPLVLLVEASSNFFSTFGWYYGFAAERRPSFWRLLYIQFASLSLAGALPTGQAGEVAKGNMLRGVADTPDIFSSLIVYNYLYVLTTLAAVALGAIVPLTMGLFSGAVAWWTFGIGMAMFLITLLGSILFFPGVLERLARRFRDVKLFGKGLGNRMLGGIREVDGQLKELWRERRGDLTGAFLGLFIGRVFSVIEVWLILSWMGIRDSVGVALMIFAATAIANYLLMALPAREGFLEGSTFLVFKMLGMVGADGLALELTRRLRKIAFQLLGLGLMAGAVRRSPTRPIDNAEES